MPMRRCLLALALILLAALSANAHGVSASLTPPAKVLSLSGGARHSIVLMSDGTVLDWGMNWNGMLGDGTVSTFPPDDPYTNGNNDRHTPIQVHGPDNTGFLRAITVIMGGESHNFALKSDGTVWSWGWNGFGQLGDGTYTDRYTPVQVSRLTAVTSLGGRGYHSLAVRQDGSVWAWGLNTSGQLGDGTITNRNTPVQVIGLSGVLSVTGGYQHSLALMPDHTLRAWGLNSAGELGDGSALAYNPTPVIVSGLRNVSQVSAGWKHSVALRSDGTVWTWGQNDQGELGDGTTTMRNIPVQVSGLSAIVMVSGGDCHTAALKTDGTVWTWGCNDRGQLGDGTYTERHLPVQVSGLTHVTAIAARDYHNLALKSDGTLWAWGWNIHGQLGDNTIITRNLPVQVDFTQNSLFLPLVVMK
jgi:alpha-tubulin suppressor-like RCC1 family protein